jgi:hypothetical protein
MVTVAPSSDSGARMRVGQHLDASRVGIAARHEDRPLLGADGAVVALHLGQAVAAQDLVRIAAGIIDAMAFDHGSAHEPIAKALAPFDHLGQSQIGQQLRDLDRVDVGTPRHRPLAALAMPIIEHRHENREVTMIGGHVGARKARFEHATVKI